MGLEFFCLNQGTKVYQLVYDFFPILLVKLFPFVSTERALDVSVRSVGVFILIWPLKIIHCEPKINPIYLPFFLLLSNKTTSTSVVCEFGFCCCFAVLISFSPTNTRVLNVVCFCFFPFSLKRLLSISFPLAQHTGKPIFRPPQHCPLIGNSSFVRLLPPGVGSR